MTGSFFKPEGADDSYKINIRTDVFRDGVIEQTDSVMGQIMRRVLDTREEQVRQALIMLGWTPPSPNWQPPEPLPEHAPPGLAVAAGKPEEKEKDPGAVRGGYARAAALTPERRSEIASIAAKARWAKE